MSDWDAIVIGAGPAGIGGASVLGEYGARVLLVDEAPGPGGQIWRGIETVPEKREHILGPDYLAGRHEAKRLRASGATCSFNTQVWHVEPDGAVWLKGKDGIRREKGRHLLIATGAMERPVPMPGWTLPGVMTVGGLQILLKREGLIPSGPLILIGTGPLVYLYAAQCLAAGKTDISLIDTAQAENRLKALPHLVRAFTGHGPSYLVKGVKLLWQLRQSKIAIYHAPQDIGITSGNARLEVRFHTGSRQHVLRAEHVGLHEGVIPEAHLPRSLGCRMTWSQAGAAFHPVRDADLQSSVPGIFVAGDAGGIAGAIAALNEGRLAAIAILEKIGRSCDAKFRNEVLSVRKAHLAPRLLLDTLYHPSPAIFAPQDDVLACRCEEVTCGAIRAALATGSAGPNQVKSFLRSGMGPCQGRICGTTLAHLSAESRNLPIEEVDYLTIRSPIRPVTLGELSDLEAFP